VGNFLFALALSMVLSPFEERWQNGELAEVVRVTLVLLLALPALGGRHKTVITGVVLVTPAVVGKWLNHLRPDLLPDWIFLVPALLFMGFVVLHLLLFIIRAPRVDSEVLCAGVAGYLMVGLLWAAAYLLVARLAPDSFVFTVGPPGSQSMQGFTGLYYSFITLTTVGYGDIVPVSSVARMLAMTEAMTGTLYMAILVARLVSLYSSPDPSAEADDRSQPGFLPTDLDRQQTTITTSTP
jgi:hypothetical protein